MAGASNKFENNLVYSRIINELQGGTPVRQNLIKKIQKKKPGTKVITYITKYGHPAALINPDDTKPIDDMLRSVGKTQRLELMLHSSGGLAENAKKIVTICRKYCDEFAVIVPDAAKSAATIISLGTDKIIMSDSSELGPTDPQFLLPTPQGIMARPAWAIVKGFEETLKRAVNPGGKLNPAFIPILSNIDISLVKLAEESLKNAKQIAEEFLKNGMLKNDKTKAEETAKMLATAEKYTMHGHLIDYKEARKLLGETNIEYLEPDNEIWELYWELYCRSSIFLQQDPAAIKLFESESASLRLLASVK